MIEWERTLDRIERITLRMRAIAAKTDDPVEAQECEEHATFLFRVARVLKAARSLDGYFCAEGPNPSAEAYRYWKELNNSLCVLEQSQGGVND